MLVLAAMRILLLCRQPWPWQHLNACQQQQQQQENQQQHHHHQQQQQIEHQTWHSTMAGLVLVAVQRLVAVVAVTVDGIAHASCMRIGSLHRTLPLAVAVGALDSTVWALALAVMVLQPQS